MSEARLEAVGAELRTLERRVAELERRIAGLEAVSPARREARLIANALQVVEHARELGQLPENRSD